MTNLLTRLREAATEMRRGVHSPGHVAAIMEAIEALKDHSARPSEGIEYTELIKDLRRCGENETCAQCSRRNCKEQAGACYDRMMLEAADAIDELQENVKYTEFQYNAALEDLEKLRHVPPKEDK